MEGFFLRIFLPRRTKKIYYIKKEIVAIPVLFVV